MKIAFPQSMVTLYSSENFDVCGNGLEVTYLDTLHGPNSQYSAHQSLLCH